MCLNGTSFLQFFLEFLSLFRSDLLFGIVPMRILQPNGIEPVSLTSKYLFLALLPIDIVQTFSNSTNHILLKQRITVILLEATQQYLKYHSKLIRLLGIREVKVKIV
jgi:hypothetical protein